MYKINLYFKSNVDGVYTKEEETATDEIQLQYKLERMLYRWFNILCPHIDFSKYHSRLGLSKINDYKNRHDIEHEIKLDYINDTLNRMDKIDEEITGIKTTAETQRKFTMTVEKI